ncbi:MAG: HD domain-containing protein [Lachnospiraceae bacterium]|nr:HD domain-containing protein [Lachnospiraceae bacterium]
MAYIDILLKDNKYKKDLDTLCALEANRVFCGHDLTHFQEVSRIAKIINKENNLSIDEDVIDLCAYLHDMGRISEYNEGINHHDAAYEYGREMLESLDVSENVLEEVLSGIRHSRHRFDANKRYNNRQDLKTLDDIISFADHFSRKCFDCEAAKDCKWSQSERIMREYFD